MTCPSCLSYAHVDVTITIGGVTNKGLQCEYCGNIWTSKEVEEKYI
jgi:aspartate carbamoyltransferase regulatory subunit